MLNWSSLGLLGVDQKGSGHYILDEGHLGKFQSIWGKDYVGRGRGGAEGPDQKQSL